MDVQSCAECGTQVSSEDIEQGNGGDVGGIFFCKECFMKLQQEEAGPEELPIPKPEKAESGPKLTLFTIMMVFFLLIIISLVIFIILIFLKDPDQKQSEPVQETAQNEKTPEKQVETPVSSNEKETEKEPAAEAEPAPKDPTALKKIRDEIIKDLDNKAYEAVYSKAEKAIQDFKDDTTLKNLHEKARVHLSDRYTALLKEGDILVKGENIKDARSVYEKCKTGVIPEFSQKAEVKLKELDALVEKAKTTKLEIEAKKLYLNCSFYFNDYMDEEDAEKKKEIAATALKHIKQLQETYSALEFVKRKSKLLKTMQNILQGKPAVQ